MQNTSHGWSTSFGFFTSLAATLGLTTQDLSYLILALIGVIVSVCSFIYSRRDAARRAAEDAKRTEILQEYLDKMLKKESNDTSACVGQLCTTLRRKEI